MNNSLNYPYMSGAPDSQTVVVTGGTGYLAGWIVAGLVERGYHVRATVRSAPRAERFRALLSARTSEDAAASVELVSADLLHDDGWEAALAGAECVMHTASPTPFDTGADLITTAREGTQRVLRAAARAGVRRVVLTSSGVTAVPADPGIVATEATRSAPAGDAAHVYPDSKILAEQDAWTIASETGLELTAVLPTFMQGPPVGDVERAGTIDVVRRLVEGKLPALPRIGWNVVDVRDIAELHILAMVSPTAAGERYLGSGTFLWYADIARIIREGLPASRARVPTRRMPDLVVRLLSHVNPQMAMVRHELGRERLVDSSKARDDLGWKTREVEQTILDTARAIM
jgi:nucleoside-diphosphate-sugar epimerase